ncbi:hypothetical protein [Dyadobacter sp. Leaf189]|uniref:PD-(D/E)XK nuclease domain-containing protein n=1 Tax=Dyadobacter sp. Leaf189 TaxID=1736295 RepID=UPI0006F4C9BE|nr:hypothetical protein [Dyadobacter sp. Leaf189]KQS26692.1 hypothetical protein ASG33_19195 [Dyadobacter sp. Leaf189]
MKTWTKEEGLDYLDKLINEIGEIKNIGRKSSEHVRWLSNTLTFLEELFGEKSLYYSNLQHLPWRETGNMIVDARNYEYEVAEKHNHAFKKQMEQARGFLLSARDQLERNNINDLYVKSSASTNTFIKLLKLGEGKLRKIIRQAPTTEKEIQDKYEDLLISAEFSYSREFPHIEYSCKHYIPDFSFPEIDLAVELKLCKKDKKLLIAQLNDDIVAYKTKFTTILFIIYDLGNISDVDEFKSSFEKQENVFVQIIKH